MPDNRIKIHQEFAGLKYHPAIKRFLEKIVVNAGIGRLSQAPNFEEKILPLLLRDLAAITGQKPQICRAKQSIAGFKLRQGQIVGLRVILRGRRLVDFFEKLIKITLPRVRDFRGLDSRVIDKGGVLNAGFKEQFVFPEINSEESTIAFSLGVNIVPKTKKREEAINYYRELGVPIKGLVEKFQP